MAVNPNKASSSALRICRIQRGYSRVGPYFILILADKERMFVQIKGTQRVAS